MDRPGISVGTCGWQYGAWRDVLYPPGLPPGRWLAEYARTFDAVEVDATFYRLPDRSVFESWAQEVPASFRFAVKASRYLTHYRRLREPEEPVERLLSVTGGLGEKIGAVLLQLPPDLRCDPVLLERTLHAFGGRVPLAVEPRHRSWWTATVRDTLTRHGVALVWSDRRGKPQSPWWVTADFGYMRLHEGRARPWPRHGPRALDTWSRRINAAHDRWPQGGFAFFNNDQGAAAVHDARALQERLPATQPSTGVAVQAVR